MDLSLSPQITSTSRQVSLEIMRAGMQRYLIIIVTRSFGGSFLFFGSFGGVIALLRGK